MTLSEFKLHNYLEAHYPMTSTAQWNGNEKKCYAYCFKREDMPYCMCNPSLMHNEEFSILAGKTSFDFRKVDINTC